MTGNVVVYYLSLYLADPRTFPMTENVVVYYLSLYLADPRMFPMTENVVVVARHPPASAAGCCPASHSPFQ